MLYFCGLLEKMLSAIDTPLLFKDNEIIVLFWIVNVVKIY